MGAVEGVVLPHGVPAPVDARVALVLEVLAGTPLTTAARRWSVEPAVAERWVRAFVEGGTARVINQPVPDEAAQRDRFLAAVTHELRSPLTVARGWAAMLQDAGDAVPAGAVDRLRAALDRLVGSVEDLELLVTASLGRLRLSVSEFRIGDLVEQLPQAPAAVEGDGPDSTVVADEAAYRRILADLWDAAALAPAPARRAVGLTRDGAWCQLSVRREGDPIEPRRLRALVEPFDRNDDATGVTFGLYLARALAVALGGTLGVEQDDQGAVLWLRTPVVPAPAGGAVRAPRDR